LTGPRGTSAPIAGTEPELIWTLRGGLDFLSVGWWILTEVSVAYEVHECPSHDLAGWRRERLPNPPDGVIELPPDWVCEIVSPGHEKKDTVTIPLPLQRHRVPWFWLIWPEERALIAHALEGDSYRVITTLKATEHRHVRKPPFDEPPRLTLRAARQGSGSLSVYSTR